MDDTGCAFGVFTTYNKTWILRRISNNAFKASAPVMAGDISSASVVLLREFIFHLSLLAAKKCYTMLAQAVWEVIGKSLYTC